MIRKIEWFALFLLLVIAAGFTLNWAIRTAIHSQKDVLVPALVNKPISEALDILSEQNLGLKKEGAEYNDTVPADTILRQQPEAGLSVREGKIIRVTISQGGETIYIPDLIGRSLRAAEVALRNHFLSLGEIRTRSSVKFEKDTVMGQDPPEKTIALKNSLVHLTVSNGPPEDGTLLMPDWVGKKWGEVEAWSKESGIKTERSEDPASAEPYETVLKQEPEPDGNLQSGNKVKVIVSGNRSETARPAGASSKKIHYEVPQGKSPKQYLFVLVDSSGNREIWKGEADPGSKLDISLPPKTGPSARVRIFVNGILTEERNLP